MGDDQERTEEPTAKKQEDARNKGQIARSKELGTLAVLLSSAVALFISAPYFASGLQDIMQVQFLLEREDAFDKGVIFSLWSEVGKALVIPMSIFFSIVVAGAFIGNILLGGYNFSWKAAEPKASRMNPLKGLKRIFGLQSIIELLKSVAKFGVVTLVSYVLLAWQFPKIVTLSEGLLPGIFIDAIKIVGMIFILLICSLIIVVVIDVPYQLYNHHKQLKMTKQEVKDERKNAEGNPQVKAKMRSMQLSMLMRRMMQDVPKADVVVTNPTHFAVALRYDPNGRAAPRVVAKGTDDIAARIREVAMDSEVPILQNPPLARALYYTTELGHEIPEGLFMAVAQVLAYVYQLREYRRGRRKRPKQPAKDLPIPEALQFDS
ncbi:MAG: flagellar biosynthetic protein FlhB [Idiomarinaceae bacterium HL-53]|nr:MAG: flagellar biosynthetic protein FlhB [Idiomarinaceae bacterium HL-53]CUS48413.1 flagellar biosynthetic protein FlhB [Idiomarinaceae bacterium HL-53]